MIASGGYSEYVGVPIVVIWRLSHQNHRALASTVSNMQRFFSIHCVRRLGSILTTVFIQPGLAEELLLSHISLGLGLLGLVYSIIKSS